MSRLSKELEKSFLSRQNKKEGAGVSYGPELRQEAKETFNQVYGRFPNEKELDSYISSGQEVKDFYKIRNACLV